ncbi:Uncharacterised protein [Streptococcus pneumoniae]|nr:Uncharacterised protein [Streptococcus pneumoniae]
MGVGKILKINQILLNIWPLTMNKVNFLIKLLTDRRIWGYNGISRTGNRTKSTASMSHSSITIGTVKSRINRDFKSLFSKEFSIIIIQGIIRFYNFHYNKNHPQSQKPDFPINSSVSRFH